MWRDGEELVCQVGATTLRYHWRAVEDLHAMLAAHGDGRFGMYVPSLLEALGLVELEHGPRNNRVRAR